MDSIVERALKALRQGKSLPTMSDADADSVRSAYATISDLSIGRGTDALDAAYPSPREVSQALNTRLYASIW